MPCYSQQRLLTRPVFMWRLTVFQGSSPGPGASCRKQELQVPCSGSQGAHTPVGGWKLIASLILMGPREVDP